jgi:signal-transduction protein with cAMP-binding, CBS, and nucleotidyltransferase domain
LSVLPSFRSVPVSLKHQAVFTNVLDKRVRAVLVMEDDKLKGIVTQGDCAIKVFLPGLDATKTLIKDIMTVNPMTVKLVDPLDSSKSRC